MTDAVEERLRDALQEVAARLPDREMAPPEPRAPHDLGGRVDRRWLIAVAAVVLVVAMIGALFAWREDDGVPVTTDSSSTLLRIDVEDVELRLDTVGHACVVAVWGRPDMARERACATDTTIGIQAFLLSGKTIVYGIASEGVRFTGTIEEVATADLHEVRLGRGAAFLLVINVQPASGTVYVHDSDGEVIGSAAFDRAGPARAPRGTLGDRELEFAFHRDGAIWVRGSDGSDLRISHGSRNARDGNPFVMPDGHTVVHSAFTPDSPFDRLVTTDARDGSMSELNRLGGWVVASSPDGAMVAVTDFVDDSGAHVEIAVLDATTFTELARIPIGVQSDVGPVTDAVWDADGRGLLVVTNCCWTEDGTPPPPNRLWRIDLDARSTSEVIADTKADHWALGNHANDDGTIPVLARIGGRVEWGTLELRGSQASFRSIAELHSDTNSPDLDPTSTLDLVTLDGRGGRQHLVCDGTNLFTLDDDGRLRLLLDNVQAVSAA